MNYSEKLIKQNLLNSIEMDWFTLTSEVLSRKKQETVGEGEIPSTNTDDTFKDSEKVKGKFEPLEAAAVSCILEMASIQLYIIDMGTCESSPYSSNDIARTKIMEVIQKTEEEVRNKGTFEVLYEKAKEEAESRKSAKLLTKSVLYNQFRIEDLKSKLRGQEFTKLKEMNQKQEIIASLKDKIHEEIIKSDVNLRYTDLWEAAKQSQNKLRCQNAESELERKLEEIVNKCNNEIRIHDEMCTFLALEEQMLLEEMERWKVRYEKEMTRRTEKIKYLETKKKEQQILLHDLTQLYEERKREIDDYLDFKEKIQLEQEQEQYINYMVTKIQAWWRGTMVRRGLGPFKKRKKLTKDKKKK